ncbi:MAG: AGE family epimerase/isomerase [Candidatus Marinimicrobia bacterium]|nr:AGE family epimerase/isomerase [Candidatus Neomarinimicrobiota bacterium]
MIKRICIIPALLFSFSFSQLTSSYLIIPELAIPYVDSCAQFWMNAWDDANGGFYSNIDRYGNVNTSWGTHKHLLSQSRNVYGLTRAFMLTGDTTYLDLAQEGNQWMIDHNWDYSYGGWYGELNSNGNPNYPNSDKSAFDQHYALLGPIALYEATQDSSTWNIIMDGYQWIEDVYWDNRAGYEGYYDVANHSGTSAWGKSFNATVDAITTHLLYLYLMTEDDSYLDRLVELADEIQTYLVGSMPNQAIGFAEKYDSNWNIDNNETMTIMGHVLKTAWCLGRIWRLTANDDYIPVAETLLYDVWDNGYDHDFGGPYKDYNRVTGEMLMWGIPDTAKAWWQMEQAIVGGLELAEPFDNTIAIEMADETTSFFMTHFVDHEYGDVYENRTRYGDETWGLHKGSSYKAGYHSIETGYYIYLYTNLFIHENPVTLYYRFGEYSEDRQVKLTPLAIADDHLKIASVIHDSTQWNQFLAEERLLIIPANTEGIFAVTFEPVEPVISIASDDITVPSLMFSNAPNPFNNSTEFKFNMHTSGIAEIRFVDIRGREVARPIIGEYRSGMNYVKFSDHGLASGMYFAILKTPTGQSTRRIVLMK